MQQNTLRFNQASSTYSILTCMTTAAYIILFIVSIKQVRLTQFWLNDDEIIIEYSHLVSIKQVRLTQFWPSKEGTLYSTWIQSFNQASSTYSILTLPMRCLQVGMGRKFQSSKFDLLNSDAANATADNPLPVVSFNQASSTYSILTHFAWLAKIFSK